MKSTIGYNINKTIESNPQHPDKKCPYTGTVSLRGKVFEGIVVSEAMNRTVKVEWETLVKDKKYARYFKTKSRVAAHNPDVIDAREGDKVLIGECRPLSKTKHFAVAKVLQRAGDMTNESN